MLWWAISKHKDKSNEIRGIWILQISGLPYQTWTADTYTVMEHELNFHLPCWKLCYFALCYRNWSHILPNSGGAQTAPRNLTPEPNCLAPAFPASWQYMASQNWNLTLFDLHGIVLVKQIRLVKQTRKRHTDHHGWWGWSHCKAISENWELQEVASSTLPPSSETYSNLVETQSQLSIFGTKFKWPSFLGFTLKIRQLDLARFPPVRWAPWLSRLLPGTSESSNISCVKHRPGYLWFQHTAHPISCSHNKSLFHDLSHTWRRKEATLSDRGDACSHL